VIVRGGATASADYEPLGKLLAGKSTIHLMDRWGRGVSAWGLTLDLEQTCLHVRFGVDRQLLAIAVISDGSV
jgi:hypothetical protein